MSYLQFTVATYSRENFRFGYKDKSYNAVTPYDFNIHEFVNDAKNGVGKIDGAVDATFSSTYSFVQMLPMYLGRVNNRGSATGGLNMHIYSFKIYEDDDLIQDLIPCYRKNDYEVGMYDLVTKTFFTNQGTGEFIQGPDV